jgi:hypothetical protein
LPTYSLGKLGRYLFESFTVSRQRVERFIGTVEALMNSAQQEERINLPLDWPKHLFHILGILQEGLSAKKELLPEQIQRMIDDLLLFIMRQGSLDDRKWALDVAGCASLGVLEKAIDIGLSSPGAWVKNSAILQVSKLAHIPEKFSKHIISNLLVSAQEELLLKKRYEIYAQFSRFADVNYLNTASLIVWMPFVDFFLAVSSIMLVWNLMRMAPGTIYPILILLLTIAGVIIRWRSSSILQTITDIYSSGSPADVSKDASAPTTALRIKQPKRSDISLIKKLMSLLTGTMLSMAGIALFLIFILSSRLYISYPYIWISLITFACLQLWSLMATLEAFRLRRTSLVWRFIYFLYPLVLSLTFPIALGFYLLDEFYLLSRAGIGLQALRKSRIRDRFFRFMYRGNYYAELWMPALLLPLVLVIFVFSELISTAAVWLVAGFVVLELLIFAFLLSKPVMLFVREWKKFETARNNLQRLNTDALVSAVEELSNRRYRSQLIHSVIEKGYLIPSSENISRLRVLIAFIQTSLANEYSAQNFKGLVEIDRQLAVSLGYVDESTYPASNNWDEEQLDLLCKMLDQLRKTINI